MDISMSHVAMCFGRAAAMKKKSPQEARREWEGRYRVWFGLGEGTCGPKGFLCRIAAEQFPNQRHWQSPPPALLPVCPPRSRWTWVTRPRRVAHSRPLPQSRPVAPSRPSIITSFQSPKEKVKSKALRCGLAYEYNYRSNLQTSQAPEQLQPFLSTLSDLSPLQTPLHLTFASSFPSSPSHVAPINNRPLVILLQTLAPSTQRRRVFTSLHSKLAL